MNVKDKDDGAQIKDNWIYIQDKNVKAGRLQIFNNWRCPFMVGNPGDVWLGVEYFCNEGDEFWEMSDDKIIELAISEMQKIGIVLAEDVKRCNGCKKC